MRPDISSRLIDQVRQAKPNQIWEGSLAAVDFFMMEVLRLHPPVFSIFGRATKDTTIGSASGVFRIAAGELLMGVIPAAHSNDAVFADASVFDPDRFQWRDQREHLIWPRGLHDDMVRSNDRTCPGKDVALAIARSFCVALLTKAEWKMSSPITWDKRWFNLNVAAPKGDLPVNFSLRALQ
jgi:cytochrome P450